MERVERCGSVSHWLLRYLQQGGAAFLTYPAHLCMADGAVQRPLGFFLAWHIKLCMPAYISDLALSHPFSSLFSRTGLCDTNGLQPGRVCFSSGLPECAVLLGGWCSLVQALALPGSPVPDTAAST